MDYRDQIITHYNELIGNGFQIEYRTKNGEYHICTQNIFLDLAIKNGTVRLLRYRSNGDIVIYSGVNIGFGGQNG